MKNFNQQIYEKTLDDKTIIFDEAHELQKIFRYVN